MRKLIIFFACASLLASCGGGGSSEKTNDTIVSPQLQEVHKTSDEIKTKSEDLNKKADSLLNNI